MLIFFQTANEIQQSLNHWTDFLDINRTVKEIDENSSKVKAICENKLNEMKSLLQLERRTQNVDHLDAILYLFKCQIKQISARHDDYGRKTRKENLRKLAPDQMRVPEALPQERQGSINFDASEFTPEYIKMLEDENEQMLKMFLDAEQ